MKTLKSMAICLLLISVLTNCTIEKRLYNKGFHVEWNKKHGSKTVEIQAETSTNLAITNNNTSTEITETSRSPEVVLIDQPVIDIQPNEKTETLIPTQLTRIEKKINSRQFKKQIRNTRVTSPNSDTTPVKREGMAIASLILGLLGVSLLAIVFGFIQLKRIKTNPETFGGKGMATAGIVLGYLSYIAFSVFFLPFQIGVWSVLLLSLLLATYGMATTLGSNDKIEPLSLISVVLGWIGVMGAIFVLYDL